MNPSTPGLDLRVRFSRGEPANWLAHLDTMRLFERSLRRAGLPVAYSQGFNPRPRLTFALPLGVGLETEDDYLDIGVADSPQIPTDQQWIERLNAALPQGVAILSAARVASGGPSLMSRVCAARYRIETTGLAAAMRRLQDECRDQPWMVEKYSKGRTAAVDIRPLVLELDTVDLRTVRLLVKAGSRVNLRPDLFLSLLERCGLDETDRLDARLIRERTLFDD